MGVADELLRKNRVYAESFAGADLPRSPARSIAIVTCMDARLDPQRALGLEPGDAHVIRNAGGVVTDDVIRSLLISQRLLGTREIAVILHTDCGMTTFDDDSLKRQIQAETGLRPGFALESFPVLEDEVTQSVMRIRSSPFIPHRDHVRGFVYDVATGRIREVAT